MPSLSGKPKLCRKELNECMVWLGKQYEFKEYQTKEEAYLSTLAKDCTRELDTHVWLIATQRQIQTLNKFIFRMLNMEPVPKVAERLHIKWIVAMQDFLTYSEALFTKFDSWEKGMAADLTPSIILRLKMKDSRNETEKEERKFLKLLFDSGVTMDEIQKLIDNARRSVADKNWQPTED